METKTLRYSDQDLAEFKSLILHKINIAKQELENITTSLNSSNSNGTDDTAGAYQSLEDGAATLEKESQCPGLVRADYHFGTATGGELAHGRRRICYHATGILGRYNTARHYAC